MQYNKSSLKPIIFILLYSLRKRLILSLFIAFIIIKLSLLLYFKELLFAL